MRLLLLATLVATASVAPAIATAAPIDTGAIDRIAIGVLARTQVPSASIAIVQSGRIVYAQAYGEQAPGQAATSAARYPIASISKQFTATAILMLADQGKLSLDDMVARYLPGLTDAGHITIRELLSHTSGYRDFWPQDYTFAAMEKPVRPIAILDRWARAPLDFPPGTQWQYSNTGFVAAGLIAEKVSGEPLMRFFAEHIFTPLAMTSAADLDTGMTAADARPHMRYALGPVRLATPSAPGWLYAAGPLAMSASDLARWDVAMLDRKLLSPAGYIAQQTPVVLNDGHVTDYGLGLQIDAVNGHRRLHHGGEATGFLSENRVYPDDGAAIVVLVSADFGNAQTAIADGIETALLPDTDQTAQARALFAMLRAGAVDRGRFTVNGNYYLTATALADYKASLSALGDPIAFTRTSSKLRGGFTEDKFSVAYPNRKLSVVLRAEPGPHGRVEQFTVYPAS